MTDRLTPGMLRDLAGIIDENFVPMQEGSAVRVLIPVFCEEAGRRDAEAKELGRAAAGGIPVAKVATPMVGREGPGSADDLVERLRNLYAANGGMWREFKEAADRIKALQARVADLTTSTDELTQAALDARFSIERLEEDKTALQARVARLTEAGRALLNEETVTVQTGYDNGPGGGNYVYSEAVRTDSQAFKQLSAALAEANDAG
jgi:FtsZ-binding cell division protein ZapB